MIYFDSAYVAKFYLAEPDSARVRTLAEEEAAVGCSIIGRAEVAQVFHRKLREQAVRRSEMRALFAQFEADCAQGLWNWFPLTEGLIAEAAAAFRRLPAAVPLRTIDAIHLITAQRQGIKLLYSSDRRMLDAGRLFKLRAQIAAA